MSRTADDMDDTHDTRETDPSETPIERYFDEVDERVSQIFDTSLRPRLDGLEADRRRVLGFIFRAVAAVAVPLLLFIFSDVLRQILTPYAFDSSIVRLLVDHWTLVLVGVAILAVLFVVTRVAMPGVVAHLNYRRRFKQDAVAEIFRTIVPDGASTYQPDHHITQATVDESGLFSGRYQTFKGDDLIRGRVGQVEYEGSEIVATGRFTVARKRNKTTVPGPNVTAFKGMFFHFILPRALRGHTIVEPEACQGRIPGHRGDFETIEIPEDERFTAMYRVYATDAPDAKEVLSRDVRQRLVDIGDYLVYPPFLAFVRNHAFVAAHHEEPLLEPTIAKQVTYGTVSQIGEFFAMPRLLVRDLALDGAATGGVAGSVAAGGTRFATGLAGGGSILGQAPAEGPTHFDANAPITSESMMDAVFPEADEKDAALPPPPASRVRLTPLTGDGLDVSYGLTPSFWIRLLWTLGLAPFVAAGVARLAGNPAVPLLDAPVLDAIVARIPVAARVADLAAEWPIPFVAIALLFWLLPTWALVHIPRSLRIDRQGVTVRRRLWPFAGHWAIDRIEGIKVNEAQVLLQRKDASLLRRFAVAAPTMRSKEEARWLAAHCRRALWMFGGLRTR